MSDLPNSHSPKTQTSSPSSFIGEPESLITEHLDIWTASIKTKSAAGRGSSKKLELVGVKKLRELILELAVRGKLVPQDPNDEPASELLKRIANEKDSLIQLGRLKKQKAYIPINKDEEPFELPLGWEWARLSAISEANTGYAFKSSQYLEKGTLVLRVTNINPDGTINLTDSKFIDSISANTEFEKFSLKAGDVLLVMVGGSLGKVGVVSEGCLPAVLNQNMWRLDRFGGIKNKYFLAGIKFINKNQITVTKSTHGHLAQGDYMSKLFPLPPFNEQHRIVAKVDELMALCDQLEAQTENSIQAHQLLVETLLATLTNAKGADELNENWQTISQHFDVLFTTQASIDQLKQTILQLAVMGKLVKQDPNDEPASKLLERIATEKQQLIKEGKIKKPKPLPPITDEEKPFELPNGWEWARFGCLVNFQAELVRPERFQQFDQVAPDSIEKGTGKLLFRRTVAESGVKGPNSRFYKGQIIYSKIRPSLSKAIIAEFDGLCSADMYPLEPMIDSKYLLKTMLSEVFLVQVRVAENRIKMPKLNIDSLSSILVPVASDSIQKLIVAKIDELMAICDSLKANLNHVQATQLQLTDAIVE